MHTNIIYNSDFQINPMIKMIIFMGSGFVVFLN